jgi:predicted dehydrogenase
MLDMVRWMLGLGWPRSVSSSGGILVDKASIANISDTQEATFDFGDLKVIWTHRSWGDAPDPQYPWGATIYGERGTLKADVHKWDFVPRGNGKAEHGDVVMELDKYPEDQTEKDLEKHVAPAVRGHMRDFLTCIANRGKERPVSNIEEGYISTSSCIMANLAMDLGRTLRWDGRAETIRDDDEARKLMTRPYRGPWVHP